MSFFATQARLLAKYPWLWGIRSRWTPGQTLVTIKESVPTRDLFERFCEQDEELWAFILVEDCVYHLQRVACDTSLTIATASAHATSTKYRTTEISKEIVNLASIRKDVCGIEWFTIWQARRGTTLNEMCGIEFYDSRFIPQAAKERRQAEHKYTEEKSNLQ